MARKCKLWCAVCLSRLALWQGKAGALSDVAGKMMKAKLIMRQMLNYRNLTNEVEQIWLGQACVARGILQSMGALQG